MVGADENRDVVLESEVVPVQEEVVLDEATIRKLDLAISQAFRSGNFDPLVQIFTADSTLIDYQVRLYSNISWVNLIYWGSE